jgi:hypothetical protein
MPASSAARMAARACSMSGVLKTQRVFMATSRRMPACALPAQAVVPGRRAKRGSARSLFAGEGNRCVGFPLARHGAARRTPPIR